jgi:hypothetical protein
VDFHAQYVRFGQSTEGIETMGKYGTRVLLIASGVKKHHHGDDGEYIGGLCVRSFGLGDRNLSLLEVF